MEKQGRLSFASSQTSSQEISTEDSLTTDDDNNAAIMDYSVSSAHSDISEPSTHIQLKISSIFCTKNANEKRKEQITLHIANMIGEDMLPLSFVENSGFKKLLKYLAPEYVVPSRVLFGLSNWNRKPAHTGRDLNLLSNHSTGHKINLVKNLKSHMMTLSHPTYVEDNIKLVYQDL
ncbi:hypothetical protein CBL_20334 [Carabus blaptoides fortunei]